MAQAVPAGKALSARRGGVSRRPTGLSPVLFKRLRAEYREACGFSLAFCGNEGSLLHGQPGCARRSCRTPQCDRARRVAVSEALRWGEPCVNLCPGGFLIWGMPVMSNNVPLGGLIVAGVPLDPAPKGRRPVSPARIRGACDALASLARRHNLVCDALIALRLQDCLRERRKAEAIHELKESAYDEIRAIYLREEPALLAAIKQGNRSGAREIVNRVLVAIYHLGAGRLDLLKSFLLELVVMMCRAAVEAGGNPSELLGVNYESLSGLSRIEDDVALSSWLTEELERVMDGIRDNRAFPNTVLLANALRYMEENLGRDISRAEVARAAGLSESRFSRLIHEKTGRTYVDLLAQFRVDRACQLISRTTKSMLQISLESGFAAQSYFTKVFRRYVGMTPREYQRRHSPPQ